MPPSDTNDADGMAECEYTYELNLALLELR